MADENHRWHVASAVREAYSIWPLMARGKAPGNKVTSKLSTLLESSVEGLDVTLFDYIGRGVRNRIALGFENAAQGAHGAVCAVVRN